jgi:hypothetical protein
MDLRIEHSALPGSRSAFKKESGDAFGASQLTAEAEVGAEGGALASLIFGSVLD